MAAEGRTANGQQLMANSKKGCLNQASFFTTHTDLTSGA